MDHPQFVERQAECATMLIAIAKILLDVDTHDFAVWLRLVLMTSKQRAWSKGLILNWPPMMTKIRATLLKRANRRYRRFYASQAPSTHSASAI